MFFLKIEIKTTIKMFYPPPPPPRRTSGWISVIAVWSGCYVDDECASMADCVSVQGERDLAVPLT